MATARHRLQLESEYGAIEEAVRETRAFTKQHLDDDDLTYRTALVVSEAVANAVEHGNQYDENKRVQVELRWNGRAITVLVQDEGRGFDSEELRDPRTSDHRKLDRGRGLFLIQEMAQEVYFEKGGARLRLVLRASNEAAS